MVAPVGLTRASTPNHSCSRLLSKRVLINQNDVQVPMRPRHMTQPGCTHTTAQCSACPDGAKQSATPPTSPALISHQNWQCRLQLFQTTQQGATTALPLGNNNNSWYIQTTALSRFFYSPTTDEQLWLAEREKVNPDLPTFQIS